MKVACQRLMVKGKTVAVAPTLGWITDAMHHVVIAETGVPQARGELRYPSDAAGQVEFPATCDGVTDWEGWIDGVNVGTAAGDFRFYLSSTIACTGDLGISPPVAEPPITLLPDQYTTLTVTSVGGQPCPADFFICLMRYVP